jgi:ketosteroid isomerase-like protein
MTEKNMKDVIRSAYAARVRGDLEGALAPFSDDAVFLFNAEGVGLPGLGTPARGKLAIRRALADLIENFRFSDWQELALIAEKEKAALHWRATVTFVPNGRSQTFEVIDLITFRGGKIVDFHQNTDSAAVGALMRN